MRTVTPIKRRGPWHDAGALVSWACLLAAGIAQVMGDNFPLALGLIFFTLGLSHGAGDEQEGKIGRISLIHAAAYLVVGMGIAGLFLVQPLAGLSIFLGLSAWHFARSDTAMGSSARLAIAALATGGSALFRPDETTQIFAAILNAAPPQIVMMMLATLGGAGVALSVVSLVKNERGAGEAALAVLATLLFHPVLAVGTIFLVGHAIPIQRRHIAEYGIRSVVKAVAVPSLIAIGGALVLAALGLSGNIALPMAAALAFGLATPHMLTERLER